jgi:hypothetical protein
MKAHLLKLWYSLTFRLICFFVVVNIVGFVLYVALSIANSGSLNSYPVPFLSYIAEQVDNSEDEDSIIQLMDDTLYSLRIEHMGHSTLQTDPTIPTLESMTLRERLSDTTAYYLDSDRALYVAIQKNAKTFIFAYR